jgi:hypothetical protein
MSGYTPIHVAISPSLPASPLRYDDDVCCDCCGRARAAVPLEPGNDRTPIWSKKEADNSLKGSSQLDWKEVRIYESYTCCEYNVLYSQHTLSVSWASNWKNPYYPLAQWLWHEKSILNPKKMVPTFSWRGLFLYRCFRAQNRHFWTKWNVQA